MDAIATKIMLEESLVGESPGWQCLLRKMVEAAHYSTIPVLLCGESGTGKERLAKLISSASAGSEEQKLRKELIVVDCGSLVPELSGSEFFGHERGAFTGALAQRDGAFALADGATLLLDEIGEVPLGLQAQLLRAIQEKTYKRVGGNVWQKTNFRLVCATNRDLEDMVHRGQFLCLEIGSSYRQARNPDRLASQGVPAVLEAKVEAGETANPAEVAPTD